ncbi:MAG: Oligo-1,6-glucosidase [Acidimicrobiales bacterium]|nr:MAG: DUF3459 domain-containing protein [Actinomycetota bacterium]MBV6509438.1 Oligo-1,6-glucosidase [Acidimicrobiales bacterium]RIK06754.1 MAG: glucohydrolase [Acidobacteriota bacterium]
MVDQPWWQSTTIYQVYPRSYADSNGDGIGDLAGIIDKLDHIAEVGFGTVWVSPFFSSPQEDFGYDVSDYCDVAPEYGTLADAEQLVEQAHARGLKVVFDLVLNHTSDQHPWFQESRRSRTNDKADWYIWRDGRGKGGRRKPNNWRSALEVRSAWQWSEERRQWFLASFLPCQPDLNWWNTDVRQAMFDVARFWLERGVDGFRLDMFGAIMKDPQFRNNPIKPTSGGSELFRIWRRDFTDNTDANIDLAHELREVCEEYRDPERVLIGEVFGRHEVLRRYLGEGDGLQLVFLFDFLMFRYSAEFFRRKISAYEALFPPPFQPTYVIENHDRTRSIDRLGGDLRKARVLAVMLLTLRGVPTVYMGQEIGMSNTYIPLRDAQDPIARHYFSWVPEFVSKRLPERINRDEVRTPMQWDGSSNAGFCPGGVEPWLPVNANAATRNVAVEGGDPASLLCLYRDLLRLRSECAPLHSGRLRLLDGLADGVLGYERNYEERTAVVLLNFSDDERRVRSRTSEMLLASDPVAHLRDHEVLLPPHSGVVLA